MSRTEPTALSDTADPTHFVGPTGNATDKYGSRNPLKRLLLDRFLREVDRIVAELRPSSILDVGCGEGVVTARLARVAGAATVGVDLGDAPLAAEWERRETDGLSFRPASAYELPFDDSSFDCVAALEVLEHLEHPQVALQEMRRVARSALVVSVPREPLWRVVHLASGQNVRRLGDTPGHLNHWSTSEIERLLSDYARVTAVRRPFPWTIVVAEPS